jgi:hypothetical protein
MKESIVYSKFDNYNMALIGCDGLIIGEFSGLVLA